MATVDILLYLWILLIPAGYWLLRGAGQDHSGMSFAYLLLFSIGSLPGALVLWAPWHARYPRELVESGVILSAVGILFFFLGSLAGPRMNREYLARTGLLSQAPVPLSRDTLTRFAIVLIILGVFSRAILILAPNIPSVTSVLAALFYCLIVGLMLLVYVAIQARSLVRAAVPVLIMFSIVLFVLVAEGFLGFGVTYSLMLLCFALARIKFRLWFIPAALIAVFLGLSLFVTYLRDRTQIRDVVWSGASLEERAGAFGDSVFDFEFFDPKNALHLTAIDNRLNQNVLVGLAAENLLRGETLYAEESILLSALFAVIPRAIWPDKPSVGGGGDVVSRFTGIIFAAGTSVGAGQILEYYVMYGWVSLIMLMFLHGALLAFIGCLASRALAQGQLFMFVRAMLAGIALVQPGGNLSEITSSFIAALIAGFLLQLALRNQFSGSRSEAAMARERFA